MNAKSEKRLRWGEMIWTMGLFAAVVVLSTVLLHRRAPTSGSVLASAVVSAVGTLLMAGLMVRRTRYPRWAFVGAATVLAASALLSTRAFPDPYMWVDSVRPGLWLHPWFLLVIGWTPAPEHGVCAPSSPFAGWLLIGTGLVIAALSVGTGWLAGAF